MMKFLQRLDEQIIDRHPNRSAPSLSYHRTSRFAIRRAGSSRPFFAAHGQHVRMLLVKFTDGTHTVVAEEFFRIEHAAQQTFHAMTARQRDESTFGHTRLLPA